ncbi:MAG: hypothetical protein QM778_25045 [Myxococcales bacterium]
MSRLLAICALACGLSSACGETGQERIELDLAVRGTSATSLESDGAVFVLERADVAVGPLYFCASEGADVELCETALAQLTQVISINGLAPQVELPAKLQGTTGEVRSALYDYGISWFLTETAPAPAGDPQHSAVLEGRVARDGRELRFSALVDVVPLTVGGSAVHGQHTRHELSNGDLLTIAVDPYAWLRPVDVDALFALDSEGTGSVIIEPGSQAYEAILQSMQNRAPIQFAWE